MISTRPFLSLLVGLALATLSGCGSSSPTGSSDPPQADFTFTASAQSVYLPIGAGSGSLQVAVAALNGFSQTVSVSASGLPSGVTTTPSLPLTLSPGANQTLTLQAASGTSASLQTITLQATSGSLSHTAQFSLSVAAPSYAYLATGYPGQPPYDLVGLAVDANTGNLSSVPGSPLSLPAMPVDLAVASETGGAFVFALVPDASTGVVALNSYSVNAGSGALTLSQTINFPANTSQSQLVVHPSEKFLYVVQDNCLLAYSIDPATGNLTQASCSQVEIGPDLSFVVAAPGNFAYTLPLHATASLNFSIYSVNQNDGSVTLAQTESAANPGTLFSDPQGRAAYVLESTLGPGSCAGFEAWQINTNDGSLTNLNTSLSPQCIPHAMTFNPADTFAYITSGVGSLGNQNGIYGAAVDSTSGNLTTIAGSPFASGNGAEFGAVEPSKGKYLLQQETGGEVAVYAIDANTGALSQTSITPVTLPSNYAYVFKMLAVVPNVSSQ